MIPSEKEFLDFLRKNPHQTYTSLSKNFSIEMGTVRDLVKMYASKTTVIKIGTALMVDIKE